MRGHWFSDSDEPLAEAEPGALWLELDNDLRVRGRGLTVTHSAPRATIGGWLAQDGVGVGSFEYGRLSENVVSANVVMRRTAPAGPWAAMNCTSWSVLKRGIVVRATLQTRRAENDTPYALALSGRENLAGAVAGVFHKRVPLWHLAFLSPGMASLRGLGEDHLLFGAYSGRRRAGVEEALRDVAASACGRVLSPADAYRAWGERFFPIAPSRPTPVLSGQGLHPGGGDPGSPEEACKGGRPGHGRPLGRGAAARL